jgi:hypothetical protein
MSEKNGRYIEIAGGKITETYTGDLTYYAGKDIISTAGKSLNESSNTEISHNEPKKVPIIESKDFDIKLSLNKEKDTLVPLAIPDFKKQ